MYSDEMRKMSDQELLDELEDRKRSLLDIRFRKSIGQVTNVAQIYEHKKTVARIKTVLRERQLAREIAGQQKGKPNDAE